MNSILFWRIEFANATYGSNTLLTIKQPKINFLKGRSLKYKALSQKIVRDILVLSGCVISSAFVILLLIICLQILMHKEASSLISILYIVYFAVLL